MIMICRKAWRVFKPKEIQFLVKPKGETDINGSKVDTYIKVKEAK